MAEFYVTEQRDPVVGQAWFGSGVFGLNIGSSLAPPQSCPICGAPAMTCTEGKAKNASTEADPEAGADQQAA